MPIINSLLSLASGMVDIMRHLGRTEHGHPNHSLEAQFIEISMKGQFCEKQYKLLKMTNAEGNHKRLWNNFNKFTSKVIQSS